MPRRLLFLLLLLWPVLLRAAEPAAAGYSFRMIAWNRELPEAFFEVAGKRRPVALPRGEVSQEISYEGPGTLTLFTETRSADGKAVKVPLATFTLDAAPARNLVVVWLERGGAYRATVLPDDTAELAPGSARFINVSGRRLALNCNRETYVMEPGARQPVPAPKGGIGFKLAVEVETRGGWQIAAMSSVRVRPSARVTVFIADTSRLATAPEDEGKEVVHEPLSFFVITDRAAGKSP